MRRSRARAPDAAGGDRDNEQRWLDEAIEESFPASDPPANTVATGTRLRPVPPFPDVEV